MSSAAPLADRNGGSTLRFWVNDASAPSFRHRLRSVEPELVRRGFLCSTDAFPRRRYGLRVLERLRDVRATDLLIVAKLKLMPGERALVRRAARRLVYDVDDAVYLGKPAAPGLPPDRSAWRMAKFAATCGIADVVVAGNEVLADAARRVARRVEVVPTPIDVGRYRICRPALPGHRLVWIGSPGNLQYLEPLHSVLSVLARQFTGFRFRVICSRFPDWNDVPIERVPWSEETHAADLAASDIGLMPLTDDEWARGKCAFKLLQYMAAGLPCVTSPVGANATVAVPGVTAFFARDASEWYRALGALLSSPERRRAMGEAGRQRVEKLYDLGGIARRVADLYQELVLS
ncbi:MAG TPA: glycosyltransferase [Thermoanaerobaculia bacterium]